MNSPQFLVIDCRGIYTVEQARTKAVELLESCTLANKWVSIEGGVQPIMLACAGVIVAMMRDKKARGGQLRKLEDKERPRVAPEGLAIKSGSARYVHYNVTGVRKAGSVI